MPKGYRICKVCGEPYEYCKTKVPAGTNRWQDVACCIEHAMEYFKAIAISRGEVVEEESEPAVPAENEYAEFEDIFDEISLEDKDDDIEDDSEDEY